MKALCIQIHIENKYTSAQPPNPADFRVGILGFIYNKINNVFARNWELRCIIKRIQVIKYLECCLSFTALAYYVQQNNNAVNLLKNWVSSYNTWERCTSEEEENIFQSVPTSRVQSSTAGNVSSAFDWLQDLAPQTSILSSRRKLLCISPCSLLHFSHTSHAGRDFSTNSRR